MSVDVRVGAVVGVWWSMVGGVVVGGGLVWVNLQFRMCNALSCLCTYALVHFSSDAVPTVGGRRGSGLAAAFGDHDQTPWKRTHWGNSDLYCIAPFSSSLVLPCIALHRFLVHL